MKKEINVTIIIVARNNWKQIKKCLTSLLRQPGLTKEIILLNDGSDDGASKDIKKFADKHDDIKLFEQKYKGLANSRNKAIKQIQGSYTLFVNQDQELLPCALQIAYKEATRINADILQLPYMAKDAKNPKKTHLKKIPVTRQEMNGAEYAKSICGKQALPTGNYANMIRSEYLKEKTMRFDHRLKDYDFDFFTKAIIAAGNVGASPYPLFVINQGKTEAEEPETDPAKALGHENDFIRRNFNEFAEDNYLSPSRKALLSYSHNMHMLVHDRQLLIASMYPRDYNKWVKETKECLMMFGGWKKPGRIKSRLALKTVPVPEPARKPRKQNEKHANANKA